MTQQVTPDIAVVTRFIRSLAVSRPQASRGHLLDLAVHVRQRPADGDLALLLHFDDLHNAGRLRVDSNGYGFTLLEPEAPPADPAADPLFISRSVRVATSTVVMQDEALAPAQGARVAVFFPYPRGVMALGEGSLLFPLTVRGVPDAEAEQVAFDQDVTTHQFSLAVQRRSEGLLEMDEKLWACGAGLSADWRRS